MDIDSEEITPEKLEGRVCKINAFSPPHDMLIPEEERVEGAPSKYLCRDGRSCADMEIYKGLKYCTCSIHTEK